LGIDHHFFDVGGHSVLAIRMVAELNSALQVKVPLKTFFQSGTIRKIAEVIEDLRSKGSTVQTPTPTTKGLVQPFDLNQAPLFRAAAVKLQDRLHLLFIDMHHIITDGMSMKIIIDEFISLFTGKQLPALSLQYKDFSEWQNDFFTGEAYRKQEEYWLECYKGEIPELNLPLDYPRPEVRTGKGDEIYIHAGHDLLMRINRLAVQQEVTPFMFFLAAYNVLLAKYTGQEDIIVGTPLSGRNHNDTERMVGLFFNMLALRNYPGSDLNFYEFLEDVRTRSIQAFANQDFQFEMLVEKLEIAGDVNRNPLFNTMFTCSRIPDENPGDTTLDLDGENLKIREFNQKDTPALFDLVLSAEMKDDDIIFTFSYDCDLFNKETIQDIADRFINILSWVTLYPEKKINEIDTTVPALPRDIPSEAESISPKEKPVPGEPGDLTPDYTGEKMENQNQTITHADTKTYYDTSSPQKRMFILNQLNSDDPGYNMSQTLLVEGNFDKEKFKSVFKHLIQRHESLRTSFEMIHGQIKQKVHDEVEFDIQLYQVNKDIQVEDIDSIEKIIKGGIELIPVQQTPSHATLSTIQLVKKERRSMDI
jgi:hypothetical protein